MRKVMKKIVASLATAAMAVGMFATMPAQEAEAGEKIGTKTIYLVTSDVETEYAVGYALNVWGPNSNTGLDLSKAENLTCSWGSRPGFTKVQDGLYKLSGDVYDDGELEGLQVWGIKATDANPDGYQAKDIANIESVVRSADTTEVWIKITADYDVTTTTPVEIKKTPGEIAAANIDAALAKDVTLENKAAFDGALAEYEALTDAEKAKVDAAKVEKLKAAVAKTAELKAEADKKQEEEDAKAAGELVIYVKNSESWSAMKLYSWNGATKFFGEWPGKDMTACEKNDGWYSAKFDITAAANIIFNNGEGAQTENIEGVAKGTYWYTMATDENGKLVATASTTAPEGWVDEAAKELETEKQPETTTAATTNKPADKAPTSGDAAPIFALLAVAAVAGAMVVASKKKTVNE